MACSRAELRQFFGKECGTGPDETTIINLFGDWNITSVFWFQSSEISRSHLVGGLEHFICFPYIGIFIIPIDELIFFRAVCPTTRSSMFIILSMQEKNDEKKYDSMISIIYINLHDLSSISKIRVLQLHPAFKAPPEAQDAPDRRGEGFQSSAGSPGFWTLWIASFFREKKTGKPAETSRCCCFLNDQISGLQRKL